MKRETVRNFTAYALFDYETFKSDKVELGNIIIQTYVEYNNLITSKNKWVNKNDPKNLQKPAIGVVIQVHKEQEDFRTDMFGNGSFNGETRFATLEEIKEYRPELLTELI